MCDRTQTETVEPARQAEVTRLQQVTVVPKIEVATLHSIVSVAMSGVAEGALFVPSAEMESLSRV